MIFWHILILWPLITVDLVKAGAGFDMFFENITCKSDDPKGYLDKMSCYVSKNVKRRTFSVELQFKKEVRHFQLNMRFVVPRKMDEDFVLMNLTRIDGCKLLSNKNQATIIKLGMSTLDRFGNMPHGCPFKKDILYYIRGFRADMNMFPAFSFEAELLLWFDFVVDGDKIIQGYLQSIVTMNKKNRKILG